MKADLKNKQKGLPCHTIKFTRSNKQIKTTDMIKKINIIFLMFLFSLSACDVLDVEPYHSIPGEDAITTQADAESAITGTYAALQAAGYYGRNYLVAGDLPADNLEWTGTTAGYNQMDNNSILADNVIVEGIWASIYRLINRANHAILQIPHVDELTDDEVNGYLAELKFLRALAHFDLVRMFGPVPIRTVPATEDEDDLNVPRRPYEDVYQQVYDDLEFAGQYLRPDVERGLASQVAVKGLLARVKLYHYAITGQQGLLHDAAANASSVIDDHGLSLVAFEDLFSGNANNESILEVDFYEQSRNRLAEYFFPTSLSGRREFSPTGHLYDKYHASDVRRDASIAVDGDNYYAIKYSDIETGTDNVYILRLAEMYLIRAEAHALLGESPGTARDDVNLVLDRAGLDTIETTDPEALLDIIHETRQLEFAFEGHRWFDLARSGRAVSELDGVDDECQTLFPIPLGELLTNFHEGMYQNDCY